MLAWLVWNPDRVLFTVPLIDRPIMIYGACFVMGFILGFFLMVWLLRNHLLKAPIAKEDIISWHQLIKQWLAGEKHTLEKVTVASFAHLKTGQEIREEEKERLLHHLQRHSREELEQFFPGALHTCSTWAYKITDKLTWYVVAGTLIGARLGHVFFYDWPRYQNNLMEIFAIWKGGLASHGGVAGVFLAVLLYYSRDLRHKFPSISFLNLLDMMVIPASLVACCIRIGNFFNQEIVGPETTLPWAVIFGDPSDGQAWVPRHPSQLYEAVAYFALFALLFKIRNTSYSQRPGFMTGLFFTLLFSFRFFIEFVKLPQSMIIDESFLQMGQFLSIPFILIGCFLIYRANKTPPLLQA